MAPRIKVISRNPDDYQRESTSNIFKGNKYNKKLYNYLLFFKLQEILMQQKIHFKMQLNIHVL